MNVEDLRKLKAELEKNNRYVVLSELNENEIMKAGEPKTAREILSQENTDEVVKRCEMLIEKAVTTLAIKGISFDQLTIASHNGLICRPDFIDELKKFYQKSNGTNEEWSTIVNKLGTQVLPEIVPVTFSIDTVLTGYGDYSLDNYAFDTGLTPKDFYVGSVSGIVNWEKFVNKMKSLGYNVEFLEYERGTSFSDYIETVKQNGFATQINITADLGRTKESPPLKM